jgi:hypothetical protein
MKYKYCAVTRQTRLAAGDGPASDRDNPPEKVRHPRLPRPAALSLPAIPRQRQPPQPPEADRSPSISQSTRGASFQSLSIS